MGWFLFEAESCLWKGTGKPIGVEEDSAGRALCCNQRETTWWHAIFEQPLSSSDHHRRDPHAILVDEVGGDQRLQQLVAAPKVQRGTIRCLQPADLVYDVTGLGGMDQNSGLTLGTPAGGVRDSDRYLIFMNQFQLDQLDGATCHITAHFPTSPQLGTWDGIVTFRYTGCLDNGPDVVCPDGGVP